MKKSKRITAAVAAFAAAVTLSGCVAQPPSGEDNIYDGEIDAVQPDLPSDGEQDTVIPPAEETPSVPESPESPEAPAPEPVPEPLPEPAPKPEPPKVKTVSYFTVTHDGVNIRSGAGTGYSVRGSAEKSTLYAYDGESGGWYKTGYKNKAAFVSSKYGQRVEMESSGDERIESVISEGAKLLGTVYVFGAVRYHDGAGRLLKGFTVAEFDCSSLMQYIFYKGANVNLQVNTRTQVKQGKTVTKSQLKRGDLMFFTNESRKNNTGIERIGHVALYLGDNWILHTASDYAKIEQISAKRWSYFIQGQRIL